MVRIEEAYGDLGEAYSSDRCQSISRELTYSQADARRNKSNPSRIPINGDIRTGLATLKGALALFVEFMDQDARGDVVTVQDAILDDQEAGSHVAGLKFGLERDLQRSLRSCIDQMEFGLRVIDGGSERRVASGFIDIIAENQAGEIVVIELKSGQAGRSAIGQILSYMGDLLEEEPGVSIRGILVAADFDDKACAAARVIPNLSLRRYSISFSFGEVGGIATA